MTNRKLHHDSLVYKLEHYDSGGIFNSWVCSYLNKGRQTMKESLYDSQNEVSSFGVPQGSVLGLLSFLIYR